MNTFDQFDSRRDIEELFFNSRLYGEKESIASVESFIRGSFDLAMVKSNPKRKVFRLVNAAGRELYLKLFAPQKFPFNIIRNYAAKEYKIAKGLEKGSVPIIEYLLWGKGKNSCSFCISEGVRNAVPARKFFFRGHLENNLQEQEFFKDSLVGIIRSLHEKHFLHPDFHTGNMIFCPDEKRMLLLDPWGIRETFFLPGKAKLSLCTVWMELKDFLSDDAVLDQMITSGLCRKKMEALALLDKAVKVYTKKSLARRAKLHRRILAGHYRFSTVKNEEDSKYIWRHNFWYAEPEKFEIDQNWEKQDYIDGKEAEKDFLHSFDHPAEEKLAVLMIRKKDGTGVLYYMENPCKKFLSGRGGGGIP